MSKFRILSIDGGGIRGIIPAIWLSEIMRKVNKKPQECFDLIVGTSTGSIIAAALATNEDISDCIDLYDNFGPRIFPSDIFEDKSSWLSLERYLKPEYKDNDLESALKEIFSTNKTIGDANIKLVIPSYDTYRRSIFLARSFDENTSSMHIWEACKASSSAPTYFPAHIYEHNGEPRPLIDGGVFANNPSILAISEAVNLLGKNSVSDLEEETQIVMISLGTGSLQRRIEANDALNWGPIQWVRPLIDVLFDSSSELSHFCARQILKNKNYVRLQADLVGVSDDLDNASEDNLKKLRSIAYAYIESTEGEEKIERIIDLIG